MKCHRHGRAQNAVCERCASEKHEDHAMFLRCVIRDMIDPAARVVPRAVSAFEPNRWYVVTSVRRYNTWIFRTDDNGMPTSEINAHDSAAIRTVRDNLDSARMVYLSLRNEHERQRYDECCQDCSNFERAVSLADKVGRT